MISEAGGLDACTRPERVTCRGKLHTYSSVFGDVAPSGATLPRRGTSGNKRKRASGSLARDNSRPGGEPHYTRLCAAPESAAVLVVHNCLALTLNLGASLIPRLL